jgi:hypothetical protein
VLAPPILMRASTARISAPSTTALTHYVSHVTRTLQLEIIIFAQPAYPMLRSRTVAWEIANAKMDTTIQKTLINASNVMNTVIHVMQQAREIATSARSIDPDGMVYARSLVEK